MGVSFGASAMFGSKPVVPTWNPVTLQGAQANATSANEANLPGIESLVGTTNQFNASQMTSLLNSVMPGWSGAATQAGKNITSELQGQIPTDVAEQIQSSTAAQALTGGFGGSGLMGNTLAKNLGLTSLQLMNQGQSSLQSWSSLIDSMYAPGQMNAASMFVDPQTMFNDTMQNQEMQFGQQWTQNQINAMPNPQSVGEWKFGTGLMSGLTGGLLKHGRGNWWCSQAVQR